MAEAVSSPRPLWRLVLVVAAVVGAIFLASSVGLSGGVGEAATTTTTSSTTTTTTPTPGAPVPAYWLVASDGGIFAFGGLPFYGSMGGQHLNEPMVGIAQTPDGRGYWTVASDGGIFSYGDAKFQGSMGGHHLNAPIVAMAPDLATGGYWLVATDGGIFAFNAPFYGSTGGQHLNEPIVAMASTPDGRGYWLFASDGGIFSYGDASFYGSTGGEHLNEPIMGGSSTTDGKGYWLVASDGGIFNFGDAGYFGSLGGQPLKHPVAAMATADQGGYWLTDVNGGVTAFGDAGYFGSTPQTLTAPIVGMADGPGTGAWTGSPSYQSGAYGYDVSGYQCASALPSGHAIGIVKAYQYGAPNSCLSQEATWAGAGLNLYIYMVGCNSSADEDDCTTVPSEPSCSGSLAADCGFGYLEASDAYQYAAGTSGVNPAVTWWLDVEGDPSWSSNTAANAAVVQGAITALRDDGINNVGVYYSPDVWNTIVGDYQPAVPSWVAWYQQTPSGPSNCQNFASTFTNVQLPTGPMWLTQYTDDATTQPNGQPVDGDYAC